MVVIKPVRQIREIKWTIFGITVAISWPDPVSERREHSEEAYYLASFLASQEKREYGIFLEGDLMPLVTVNPLNLEVGTYVDHCAW